MMKLLLPMILVMGTSLYYFLTTPLLIESAESRTIDGKPVFNEIQWNIKDGKEMWTMRQSHGGKLLPKNKWDSLAIHMDERAKFLQLDSTSGARVEYKVSCFMCHSNGPRAIRPVEGSLGPLDQVKVTLLNLRIKLYGRVKAEVLPQLGETPFRHEGKISNAPLLLTRCTSCHNETSLFSRGTLTRQNSLTISFMVNKEHMPPLGSLSFREKQYLENFMDGISTL